MCLERNMGKKPNPEVCILTNALDSGQTEAFLWSLCEFFLKYSADLNSVLLCAKITYKKKASKIKINTEQARYSIMFL